MEAKARSIGYLAYKLLEGSHGAVGEVVNAFASTVNARIGGELVILTFSKHRSPISINLAYPRQGRDLDRLVKAGDPVIRKENTIIAGNLKISLEEATLYFNSLKTTIDQALSTGTMSSALLVFQRDLAMVLELLEEVTEEVIGEARQSIQYAINRLVKSIAETCSPQFIDPSSLLGLGQGFTPSSDDFLLGFIAAWNSFSKITRELYPILPSFLVNGRTHWVSRKLLENATRLNLLEPLDELLYDLIVRNSPSSALNQALDIASIGHSSGIYILKGLLDGLRSAIACTRN